MKPVRPKPGNNSEINPIIPSIPPVHDKISNVRKLLGVGMALGMRAAWYILLLATVNIGFTKKLSAGNDNCFSCRIEVTDLDSPKNLEGAWLFTREDDPSNALPEKPSTRWILMEAPGPWTKGYKDKKNFNVGWYRGNFRFTENLIGQKAVFYIDAYMSKMDVYLDGKKIFDRHGQDTHRKYYSIQPVPVVFDITATRHVIAVRIDTRLMTGIYQSPFQLRPYKAFDPFINFIQIFCGELRYLFAYIFAWTGGFFVILYVRTKYPLYLMSGLTGIGVYPFYAMPNDLTMKFLDPDVLLLLHYPGIGFMALGYFLFSQVFTRVNRTASIVYCSLSGLYALFFLYMLLDFHMGPFQIARKTLFLFSFGMATHGVINCLKGFKKDRRLLIAIMGQVFFWVCAGHDILLALGLVKSTSLIFIGTFGGISSIMLITTQAFAETFIDNKRLLSKVEAANVDLEKTVQERTANLREKTEEITSILDSLPEGILEAGPDLRVLGNFSQAVIPILDTQDIQGKDLFELVFQNCNLSSDDIAQARSVLEMTLGESKLTFDANRSALPSEIDLNTAAGVRKHLALGWGAICDEAGDVQKILLTLIDVSQQKVMERESALWKLRSQITEALIAGPQSRFLIVIKNGSKSVEKILQVASIEEWDLQAVYRELHTLKGNARAMDLSRIADLCHQAETSQSLFKKNNSREAADNLRQAILDLRGEINAVLDLIRTINKSINQSRSASDLPAESPLFQSLQKGLRERKDHASLLAMLQSMHYMQARKIAEDLDTQYDGIAQALGKSMPQFDVEIEANLYIEPAFAQSIQDILGHLIRNSMDHGIEFAEERRAKGKPIEGHIVIGLRLEQGALHFYFSDDGAGLSLWNLRAKAVEQGLCRPDENNPFQLLNLIFHSGFSMAAKITTVSGRGVGMDAIQDLFNRWHGKFSWSTRMTSNWDKDTRVPFAFAVVFPGHLALDPSAGASKVYVA